MLDKIIGSVLSNVLSGTGNGTQNGSVISDVLGSLLKNQGGMEGVFSQLQKSGLDDLLDSWIETGQNRPMSANQVNDAFGDEAISNVAQQAGVDKTQAQDILSQALPQIIDMLTPNGREGGVTTDTFAQQAQQVQQENGFGLDDLLGGLLGGRQSSSQQPAEQGGLGDLLGQILNGRPTGTSRTAAPSSNDELAQDIGAVLNGFFK